MDFFGRPARQGLYDPANEHDACGVGFIAHIKNRKSHAIVADGIRILDNLAHRGAVGADPLAGDGAGILIQLPDGLLRAETARLEFVLPAPGHYGLGMVFLPRNGDTRRACEAEIARLIVAEGQKLLGWRDVPVDSSMLGESIKPIEPVIRQFFIERGANCADADAFERKLFVIRKQSHKNIRARKLPEGGAFYIASLSTRTVIYKGMMIAERLALYYGDLKNPRTESALALVHARFSTNTFPSWELAHPFRYLAHNGEINTLKGNINWMMARRRSMTSKLLGEDLEKLWPLIGDGNSDSATLDNCLELLIAGGYPLTHALMMMIPEAWADNPMMDKDRRAFYEYHAALMEPWDGPAALAFTDGRQIGATLDRNGLRPARFFVTSDDLVVMASEAGVLDVLEERIIRKWRLEPGKMLLVDLEKGKIVDDSELKGELSRAKPYQAWLDTTQIKLENLPADVAPMAPPHDILLDRQQAFGYTQEDIKFFLKPMALSGQDSVGSMGRDTPLAVLSDRPKQLFDYFQQRFAQVTNPPIDSIREELVMSLVSLVGPRPNLLDLETGGKHIRLELHQPVLTNVDLERIRHIEDNSNGAFRSCTLTICYPAVDGAAGMEPALTRICKRAEEAVLGGFNIIILSDRDLDSEHFAVPSLLAVAAVHHHLIRNGLRTEVGLVVETGEARQLHDFCLLAGYGAEAINPYLAFDSISSLKRELANDLTTEPEAHKHYIKAISKGILKVMSKMGICTFQSYCGAQIFDAVGLNSEFLDKYFTGTTSPVEGIGLKEVAEETARRHRLAYGDAPIYQNALDPGGEILYRVRGERHVWTMETVGALQHAVRAQNYHQYKAYARRAGDQDDGLVSLRGLLDFDFAREPVPLDEVEPAATIMRRFSTGAMSFGSISWEAHTTLAIAMNRIGGRSNTGEGGEDPRRYQPLENGDSMRSAIKQVASGRFGVNAEYLVNGDVLQIKMAQGAKPGEGGQLPGHKVDDWIARVRHSIAGVGLISPPPHHDIYSIEDLKQLIHDLKNVNPRAWISVKLVSEIGVGTIAAGVAKAYADHVTISGQEGGTGASPLTSIHHAGEPWEIGLAETHQTLVLNGLRGRIAVQVDGGLRSGRDVVMGALLGADEFGFATAALIAEGCVMMRKCHLNTCPVGVATQDTELRSRFIGKAEDVITFFRFVAEETREIMAKLGFRTVNEMIGRTDKLVMRKGSNHPKAGMVNLARVLHRPVAPGAKTFQCEAQDHRLGTALDHQLIAQAARAIEHRERVKIEMPIRNVNRSVGGMLSGEIARRYGDAGLPDPTIEVAFKGTAGQSFGAFLAKGVAFTLEGAGNDYVGKGLSGGRLVIRPPAASKLARESAIIVGNTVLYGAISGECYFSGVAGERFAVRNSGAVAVVEGAGAHACEYMTGGIVALLGDAGQNFAAGMSGGVAYVLDERGDFATRCNATMVALEELSGEDGPVDADTPIEFAYGLHENDVKLLRRLIERHARLTGSPRARMILDHWEIWWPRFVKVMPIEYRRALEKMDAASCAAKPALGVAVSA